MYKRLAGFFVAVVVLVGLCVLWLTSVKAEVHIKVKQEAVTLDGNVEVAAKPSAGQITGKVVTETIPRTQEFTVADKTATTTPPTPEPVTPPPAPTGPVRARGSVRIVNESSRSQPLVRTTRLLTADGKLYRIDRDITVKAGAEVAVEIYADKLGEEFAIQPTRFTIPGLFIDLQKSIYAVSDKPFEAVEEKGASGGSGASAGASPARPAAPLSGKIVTQGDVDAAEQALNDAILAQAKKMMADRLPDDPNWEVIYAVRRIDKGTNAKVGERADSFLASLTLEVSAIAFPKEDLTALIRAQLKDKVPSGRELLPLTPETLRITGESADAQAEKATLHVQVETGYRLSSQSPLLQKTLIAGKRKDEAVELLKAVEGVEDATVTLKPSWFSTIPSLKDRIEIVIE